MQHSLPPIPQKARNGWGTAFQNFWAGSISPGPEQESLSRIVPVITLPPEIIHYYGFEESEKYAP
jgi:hypothetical protein